MKGDCKVSSKGQITVPIAVRRHLGVKTGDKIRFVERRGRVVVEPVRAEENPFVSWLGALSKGNPDGHAVAWVRSMRDEDDPS